MDENLRRALEAVRKLKHVDMEHKGRKEWEARWRKRTAEEILKEGVVWGCRDVAVVLKHLLGDAKVVEGVRICSPGGHVWIEYRGKYYDVEGEFDPLLSPHGPYVVVDEWMEDPAENAADWWARYGIVKISYEAPAIAYAAFGHDWLFHHTERVAYWAERLTDGWERRNRAAARLAAWIHDMGRVRDPKNHAEVGARWAERWLEHRRVPRELIDLVVDGVRNHGSSSKPKTDVGHVLRLADALALWDPLFVGMYALILSTEERQNLRREMEKKWAVIEEYGRTDLVDREKVLSLLSAPFK